MKALYIPSALLIAILGFSLWAGQYVSMCTQQWTDLLDHAEQAAAREDWEEAERRLETAYADWDSSQTFFHTIMDHDELDEAEKLFAGAFAVCREEDGADFHQMLSQLSSQLRLLSETQSVSIKNVF